MQVCKEQLSNGKSVVVDNTNPKVEARKSFIQLAQKQGKPRQVIPCHTHHINRAWNVILVRFVETENFQSRRILLRLHEMKNREMILIISFFTGIPCRCFVMNTPLELAKHLNYVRQNQTDGEVRRIPEVGYNVYKKGYSEPTKGEGFSEIVQIDFIPSFNSKRDEALFKQWTSSER